MSGRANFNATGTTGNQPPPGERQDWLAAVAAAMRARRVDRATLAARLGLSRSALGHYLAGRVWPTADVRERIEAALAAGQEMTG